MKQSINKMLKNETPTSQTKYTEYNSTLQKIKWHAQKYYFKSKCAENKSNTKELWQLINKAARKISDKQASYNTLIQMAYNYITQKI